MEHKVLEHKASAPNEYMCPQTESTTNVYLTPNIELERSYAEPNFAVGRSKFYGMCYKKIVLMHGLSIYTEKYYSRSKV